VTSRPNDVLARIRTARPVDRRSSLGRFRVNPKPCVDPSQVLPICWGRAIHAFVFFSAYHAARCVACDGVRSHAVPVALVGECSIPVV
jgi:hypothetical protein